MNRKSDAGPEGRPLNFSPARKGWETDRQDCGALEARHYQHSGCRTSGARTMLRNRCPSPAGLGWGLAVGPPGLDDFRGTRWEAPKGYLRYGLRDVSSCCGPHSRNHYSFAAVVSAGVRDDLRLNNSNP